MFKVMLTPKEKVPKGVPCRICNKVAKEGQFIVGEKIDNVGWFISHKTCMENLLNKVPDDLDNSIETAYTVIQQSLERLTK